MNIEFEKYKESLNTTEKPPAIAAYSCKWEDLVTHNATKEEAPIIAEAKKQEKKVLCLILSIATLFLLVSIYGLFFEERNKIVFVIALVVDMLVWFATSHIISSVYGTKNDKIVYGCTEYIFFENKIKRDSDGHTHRYTEYYADFYIPTIQKYLKKVHIESSNKRKKLKEGSHVALYSFRVGVPNFMILNDDGELL